MNDPFVYPFDIFVDVYWTSTSFFLALEQAFVVRLGQNIETAKFKTAVGANYTLCVGGPE